MSHPVSNNVCRYFASNGNCYYGDQCIFAHVLPVSEQNTGSSVNGSSILPLTPVPPKNQIPCRNISVHGFCKFAGKGCEYNHDVIPQIPKSSVNELVNPMQSLNIQKQPLQITSPNDVQTQQGTDSSRRIEITQPTENTTPIQTNTSSQSTSASTSSPLSSSISSSVFSPSTIPNTSTSTSSPSLTKPNMQPQSVNFYPNQQQQQQQLHQQQQLQHQQQLHQQQQQQIQHQQIQQHQQQLHHQQMQQQQHLHQQQHQQQHQQHQHQPHQPQEPVQAKRGGTIYFYNNEEQQKQQDQSSASSKRVMFSQTDNALPHVEKQQIQQQHQQQIQQQQPGRRSIQSFFMNEDVKREIIRRTALLHSNPYGDKSKDLPSTVYHYHSLVPLDDPQRISSSSNSLCGFGTSVYKAVSSVDGLPYVIRKIEGFRLSNEHALRMGDMWKQLQNPSVISLNEIFISKDFGDINSLFFSYDYHPGSESLESRYFSSNMSGIGSHSTGNLTGNRKRDNEMGMAVGGSNVTIPESVIWSYICQLVGALRSIHNLGLACRNITLSRILITGKNRIRINSVGIQDVVNFDGGKNIPQLQHDDIIMLGQLILLLTTRTTSSQLPQNLPKSLEFIANHYSIELKNLVIILLGITKSVAFPTIDDIVTQISRRMMNEMENIYNHTDLLESSLMREYENGRLFRLMVKLGFINERPEYDLDPSWSETGDRYLLKLFRDYVFHQVYEDGNPVVDLAHVVECLNKLDIGADEKIVLMSRDEQSVLIVSYKDLKRCVEDSFNELQSKKNTMYRYRNGQ